MEAYRTKCRDRQCAFERTWIGFKTGIGKTWEQIAQMQKDQTTCIKCEGPAHTTLDERGLVGAMDAREEALKFLQY
jgi:hypothetical protein